MVPSVLRRSRSTAAVVGTFVLVGALAVGSSRETGPVWRPVPVAPDRVAAGPLLDRTGARLTVGDAASRVRVWTAALPGQLYRVSSAADSGVAPVVTRIGGRVVVRLRATGSDGLDEVRIVLNRDVRWDLRLPAGAGEQQLNLRGGRLSRVELGASGLAEITLPDPAGTVPVIFTGGVGSAVVSAGTAAPFRIVLDRGAGAVVTPWEVNNGAPAGVTLREDGWRRAVDRYAVRAVAGMGSVVLRRYEPARRRTR